MRKQRIQFHFTSVTRTNKAQNRNKKASVTADDYSLTYLATRKQHLQHPIITVKPSQDRCRVSKKAAERNKRDKMKKRKEQ